MLMGKYDWDYLSTLYKINTLLPFMFYFFCVALFSKMVYFYFFIDCLPLLE